MFQATAQPQTIPQLQQTRSAHAISNPTLAGIEKRWEAMPPQEQAELWMQLRDRMKVDWNEMTLQEKKAGMSGHPIDVMRIHMFDHTMAEQWCMSCSNETGANISISQHGGLLSDLTALEQRILRGSGPKLYGIQQLASSSQESSSTPFIRSLDRHQRR
jgi:hypothetical protein